MAMDPNYSDAHFPTTDLHLDLHQGPPVRTPGVYPGKIHRCDQGILRKTAAKCRKEASGEDAGSKFC